MSDELLNCLMTPEEIAKLPQIPAGYNQLYRRAWKVMKEKNLSARSLDKVVWCMYHSPEHPPQASIEQRLQDLDLNVGAPETSIEQRLQDLDLNVGASSSKP